MKKILAIDDQQDNLTTLKAVIKNQIDDCLVLTSLTGKEGIEIARKEQPDTILLDIIMPQMDGYEVCKKLKADELTKHIPVIMLTAIKTDIESRVKGLNIGADAFLSKPIDEVELSAQVKVMFRIKEAEDQLRSDKNILEELVKERTKKLSESEELYRLIAENTSDNIGITTFDLKAKYLYVSPSIKSVLDYEEEDLIGKSFFDFIHPDDKKRLLPLLKEYVQSKVKNFFAGKELPISRTIEFRFKNKKGEWRSLQSALNIVGDNILAVSKDITDQKAFESKLKSNERMLRDIIDTSPNLIFVKDRNGKYLVVNKAMADYHRTTPEKLVGTYDYQLAKDYFKTNDYNELRKKERNVIENKQPLHLVEDHFINDFGDERWFQTVMLPFDNADNQNCIMIIAADITEFVRIREALKESDLRFQELVELLPEAVIETDKNMTITYANKRAQELSGFSEKDFEKGINGIDLLIPADRNRAKEYFIGRANGLNPPKTIQYQAIKKDGSLYHIHFYADSIVKDGVFKGIRAIIVDVSAQKKIEQELLDSKDQYESLFNQIADPVVVFDKETNLFLHFNTEMIKKYGFSAEELYKMTPFDLHPEDTDMEQINKNINDEKHDSPHEYIHKRKDGITFYVETHTQEIFYNGREAWITIIRDITERKKTESELRKSEQDFRGLFENSHDAIIIFAPEGEIVLDVNERACNLYGLSRHEFIGMSLKNITRDLAEGEKNVQRTLKEGFFNQFETIQYKKDGSPLYLEINASMVEFGGQKAILSNNRDITKRKLAEEAYHESAEKYRHLYNTSNDAIFLIQDNKFISCNPRTLEMYGCTEEEIIGLSPIDFSPKYQPDGKLSSKKAIQMMDAVIAGNPQFFEWLHYKKNGSPFDAEITLNKMVLPDGEYIHAIVRDISDRKRSEKIQKVLYNISDAVSTSKNIEEFIVAVKEELGNIIDTTNYYIAFYDKQTDTFYIPFYADEYDNAEYFPAGKSMSNYVVKNRTSLLATYVQQQEMADKGLIEFVGARSKTWLGVPLEVNEEVMGVLAIQSYTDENAYNETDLKLLEFVSDQISISLERKKNEQDLKAALAKATESDRLKSTFLATMSHELRTPLNAIIGFSDIINKDLSIEEIIDFNHTINTSGNHLLTIVEDLFDITLIDTGEIKIIKEVVNIGSLLNEVKEIIKIEQHKLKKDQVELNLNIPDEGKDLMIKTDPARLKQILINLLKNALKFTDEGSVKFGFTLNMVGEPQVTELSRSTELTFYVKDTGIGVSLEKQNLIFDIFRQVEDTDTRKYGGTGIGLSISKKLAQLLGGDIWIESEKGLGSSFYFTIPMDQSYPFKTPTTNYNELNGDLKDKIVLVVEDDKASFEYLKVILSKPGYQIIWAVNGEEAVTICKENMAIVVVLMDINMPVMNGYDATKAIKKLRPSLPIIAQTAYAVSGDHEKAIGAGCDDYISKPIKKELLLDKIGKLLSNL